MATWLIDAKPKLMLNAPVTGGRVETEAAHLTFLIGGKVGAFRSSYAGAGAMSREFVHLNLVAEYNVDFEEGRSGKEPV